MHHQEKRISRIASYISLPAQSRNQHHSASSVTPLTKIPLTDFCFAAT
jgi:hypothetical protein